MAFINGLEISDATGRAFVDLNAALPVPPGKSALGGMLYNNVGGIGRVQVDDSGSPAPFSVNDGFLYNANGQLEILMSLPGGAPLFNNGVRVNQVGAVAISAGGPIANWVHGWPVTIDGALCIDTGGGGGTVVTWNPADIGVGTTLSNGNLTTVSVAGVSGVRATQGRNSGKYYFEVVIDSLATGSNAPGIGIATAARAFSSSGIIAGGATGATVYPAPTAFTNFGGPVSLGVNYLVGDVWGVAVDITAGKIWWSRGGVFTGAGNPAAGTGNPNTFTAGNTYFPMVVGQTSGVTARFASASWGFAAPSGFGPWGGAGARAFSEAFAEGFA